MEGLDFSTGLAIWSVIGATNVIRMMYKFKNDESEESKVTTEALNRIPEPYQRLMFWCMLTALFILGPIDWVLSIMGYIRKLRKKAK